MITSKDNEKLKTVRKLNARRRDRDHLGMFVAEGEDLVQAAHAAGWEPLELLVSAGSGLDGTEVAPELLRQVTELSSGCRQLGVYKQRWAEVAGGRLQLYLHGVSDPGNVGTIIRSAAAFGAGGVILGPGSADPFSPRAVRASMGAIFQVAVVRAGSPPATSPGEPVNGLAAGPADAASLRTAASLPATATAIALDANAEQTLAQVAAGLRAEEPVTLLVGAEREGLPEALRSSATHVAKIPILTDSLNAAIAASIALYELTSSRSPTPDT